MTDDIFKEGGPLKGRRTGPNQFTFTVPIPDDGRRAHECPNGDCSPGYFKVVPGTGLKGESTMFCPYCRREAPPESFATEEQLRYAKEVVGREAFAQIQEALKRSLGLNSSGSRSIDGGLISIDMSLKASPPSVPRRPREDELRRDVVCPHCTLDQSVFGLATWCADCGRDIFLTHVKGEQTIVRSMLSDIPRRREVLGSRVAAKDLENCLEDSLSIFEAVLKLIFLRFLQGLGLQQDQCAERLRRAGNSFQNLGKARDIIFDGFKFELLEALTEDERYTLEVIFNKRHPIAHNLGVVDKKYLAAARSGEAEGREVELAASDIEKSLDLSFRIFSSMFERLPSAESRP